MAIAPAYEGSKHYTPSPIPLVAISWRDTVSLGIDGLLVCHKMGDFRFGGGLAFDPGRKDDGKNFFGVSSGDHRLKGLGKEMLRPGHYYLAPGDFHMLIIKDPGGPMIKLVKEPRENFCRPAVDPMLQSLPGVFGRHVLVVMLTGMGSDGVKGSEKIVAAGGQVMAQNEATSVVWGMPGAVATAGLCSAVLPIEELGAAIRKAALEDNL